MRTRKHHNNEGRHTVKSGKVVDQLQRIAAKLKLPFSPKPKEDQ